MLGAAAAAGCGGTTLKSDSSAQAGKGGAGCAPGSEGCACYGNDTCDVGLTCASHLCVNLGAGGSAPGGASTGGTSVGGSPRGGASVGGSGVAWTGGMYSFTGGASNLTGGTTGYGPSCPGLPYQPEVTDAGVCTGTGASAEPSKLDIYIMQDRTQSMGTATTAGSTRWLDLKTAVEAFVTNPQVIAQDIRVGIQFFSLTGGFQNATDCVSANYANPAVEIGPLATTGPQIVSAIEAMFPSGETPSIPALQGAIQHAVQWQARNPDRQTIVLLVTDGFPTMCDDMTDKSFFEAAAAGLASSPPVETYIVGISVGANVFRLRDLAIAGGSGQPFLVEDATAVADLNNALMSITRDPLPCEYQIPTPSDPLVAIRFDRIQVVHTPASGAPEEVPYATTRGGCSAAYGGWYYDTPPNLGTPSQIIMCPCTCSSFGAGTVDIYVGCQPQITGLQ